jgi:hypothetical protein
VFAIVLVASPAHAEMPVLPDPPPTPSTTMVALHLGVGREPVPGDHRTVFTDGLQLASRHFAIEGGLVYAFGDVEHAIDTRATGIYGAVSARQRLAKKSIFYLDVEAGIGGILARDSQLGRLERPDAFVGLRTGYELEMKFSAIFDVRLVETPSGVGWMAGVGMGWGG